MTTIESLYQEHGVRFKRPGEHHHCVRGWINTDCPYCSPGQDNYRLGFNVRRKKFNCWACGFHRVGETLCLLLNVEPDTARKYVVELQADLNDDQSVLYKNEERRGKLVIPDCVEPMSFTHKKYLDKRGYNAKEIANIWEVQGISVAKYLSWRLFIPIHDHKGEQISWTTRAIGQYNRARYISARPDEEKVSHKHVLYGEHMAGHAVIVCEGPLDAWAVGPGGCCITGLNPSRQQVFRIAQHPVRVICFDNERNAQKRADILCEMLAPLPGETHRVQIESAKDLSEAQLSIAGRRELAELRKRFLQ